ncbi:rCG63714 [Rattus norvegicus]|uniref:RCG63714 n=1 Tax=Rattus norvegicus TaxID=10116 RepID=A6I7E8_RAT|nr:rCG63714 [Rattus norvegicus]
MVFQAPDLSGMLQKFRELTAVRAYWGKMLQMFKSLCSDHLLPSVH